MVKLPHGRIAVGDLNFTTIATLSPMRITEGSAPVLITDTSVISGLDSPRRPGWSRRSANIAPASVIDFVYADTTSLGFPIVFNSPASRKIADLHSASIASMLWLTNKTV